MTQQNLHNYFFYILILFFCINATNAKGQDETLQDIVNESVKKDFINATFKSTHLINFQTIEVPGKRTLDFRISHRFGDVESGVYNFYGLDGSASIRIGFDYSYDGRLAIGIGRSNVDKMFDGSLKFKWLRQTTNNKMPISLTLFSGMYCTTINDMQKNTNGFDKYQFATSRLSYAHQIIVGRKFNKKLSLQLAPTVVHFNQVDKISDKNDSYSMAFAGRYKLSKRIAFTTEYNLNIYKYSNTKYYNSLGFGLDIETGGHVFQVHFTNSIGLAEPHFLSRTTQSWTQNQFRLGFNISRVFTI